MQDEKLIVNQYGTNTAIKAHVLPEEEMERIGFRFIKGREAGHVDGWWDYSKMLVEESRYDDGISFNCAIYVGEDVKYDQSLRLDVLDEAFCQHYDWQHILKRNPEFKYALKIKRLVYEQMHYLQDNGVISGWEEGMYI